MRLSTCAAIGACLAGIKTCFAAPPPKSRSRGDTNSGANDVKVEINEEVLKYFHEPAGDDVNHYDRRYFHGKVGDEERVDTQSHMMRAYLNFFDEKGLDTWLAHGTLLGWWWNGKRLPWDWDLDTQVSHETLYRLGRDYNQTRYHYKSSDGTKERDYLLDVNPFSLDRQHGDGMNIIDARWIDVRNGLYVDVTGLSELEPELQPGIISCKNYHNYQVKELYPMRDTMFEGVVARVPYAYDKILRDEYRDSALVNTDFYGHMWDSTMKEWVKSPETLEIEEKNRKWKEEEDARIATERWKLD